MLQKCWSIFNSLLLSFIVIITLPLFAALFVNRVYLNNGNGPAALLFDLFVIFFVPRQNVGSWQLLKT
jgi:hypothetical protein